MLTAIAGKNGTSLVQGAGHGIRRIFSRLGSFERA